jgi:hypothetical protein
MTYDFSTYTINNLALALDSCRMRFEQAHRDYVHAERDLQCAENVLVKADKKSADWYHAKDAIKDAKNAMLAADEAGGKELDYKHVLEVELLSRQPRFQVSPQTPLPRLREIILRLLFPRVARV